MNIPAGAETILKALTGRGFQAYAVGGCVRDTLLGRAPGDWDICTSALPEEVEACFSKARTVETGLRYGTVTVILEGKPYEITTFRRDGTYFDHRRPEQVSFVSDLKEDLQRRDFTINAMAVGLDGVIQDPFDGQADLEQKCLRCVGNPAQRFEEDALRILRGLRFASQLGFEIDSATARAMEQKKHLLEYVSGERIYRELTALFMGPYVGRILSKYGTVLTGALPEIAPCMNFLQHHPSHHLDVWEHTVAAVAASKADKYVRWALLLHDVGKPATFTMDEQGVGHFYGHAQKSAQLAQGVFNRLRADRMTRETVCFLVEKHGIDGPVEPKIARRWLSRFGKENTLRLLEVKRCDCLAHADIPMIRQELQRLTKLERLVWEVLEEDACLSLKTLAVDGRDALTLGIPEGPAVGTMLNELLEEVLEGSYANDRAVLLQRLSEKAKQIERKEME